MDDHTDDHHAPENQTESEDHTEGAPAPRRRRWRRPNGRWTNPASPLQAARFAARMSGKQVAAEIRRLCDGHAGRTCKFEVSKLSDFEHARRRPSIEHVVAFCKLYQRSPEELGLIRWRDEETPKGEPAPPASGKQAAAQDDPDQDQLLFEWLRDSAIAVATVASRMLAACPVEIAPEPDEQRLTGDDDSTDGEDDPPAGVRVPV